MGRRTVTGLCLVLCAVLASCNTGDAARVRVLAPAVKLAWEDGTKDDAALGVAARANPAAAAILGVEPWSPEVAEVRREKHAKLSEAINKLQPTKE